MRKNIHEAGFMGVEALLIAVLVIILAVGGWFVYKHNHKTTTYNTPAASSSTSTQQTATTANWKTYTLTNEKLSFKYPSTWTVKPGPTPLGVSAVTPGMDNVSIVSPSGLEIALQTGLWGVGGDGQITLSNEQVSAFGGTYYLNYQGCDVASPNQTTCADQTVKFAYLGVKANASYAYPAAKNVTFADKQNSSSTPAVGIFMGYGLDAMNPPSSTTPKPLNTFKNDASYADAKQIVQSLSY